MKKSLLLLAAIITFSSCAKKEDETKAKEGIELYTVGLKQFGSVLLGESRFTTVKILNHGPGTYDVNYNFVAPFDLASSSGNCNRIFPGQECNLEVEFNPTEQGNFETTINAGIENFALKGSGQPDGYVVFSESTWDLGVLVAGAVIPKTLIVSNGGESFVGLSSFNVPSGVVIKNNTCPTILQIEASCTVNFEITKTNAGVNFELITMGTGVGYPSLELNSTVVPSVPYGTYKFNTCQGASCPTLGCDDPANVCWSQASLTEKLPTMLANGSDQMVITTEEIKDQYGNLIPDGTAVRVYVSEKLYLMDGSIPVKEKIYPTINSKISFILRASLAPGFDEAINWSSPNAYGFIRIDLGTPPE